MTERREEIFELLTPIFSEVLDLDDLIVTSETSAATVEGWDSLAHMRLVVTIEKFFNIHFSASEVAELQNVGELAKLIIGKHDFS
jgi:acyl carrier protein